MMRDQAEIELAREERKEQEMAMQQAAMAEQAGKAETAMAEGEKAMMEVENGQGRA